MRDLMYHKLKNKYITIKLLENKYITYYIHIYTYTHTPIYYDAEHKNKGLTLYILNQQ